MRSQKGRLYVLWTETGMIVAQFMKLSHHFPGGKLWEIVVNMPFMPTWLLEILITSGIDKPSLNEELDFSYLQLYMFLFYKW
jgi:hypothetical protein